MSGTFISVEIDDHDTVNQLKELLKRGHTILPVMKRIGVIIQKSVVENFIAEGRPTPWKPLAQSTMWNMIGGSSGHLKSNKNPGMKTNAVKKTRLA